MGEEYAITEEADIFTSTYCFKALGSIGVESQDYCLKPNLLAMWPFEVENRPGI
jgi:hypothetical protein